MDIQRTVRIAFVLALAALGSLVAAAPADAERDHLQCYRIEHAQRLVPRLPIELSNQLRDQECVVEQEELFCAGTEKNGGDDPRGGEAADFVCYRLKCDDASSQVRAEDQFGTRGLQFRRATLVCAPVEKIGQCGPATCAPGTVCCDPLFGICTAPGEVCIAGGNQGAAPAVLR